MTLTRWKIPILISYAYWNKGIELALTKWKGYYHLIIDSGAFTAFKQGKEISLEDYCNFCKNPPVPIERYFTLDKIGDPEVTKINFQKMIDFGLNPIPIFTRGGNEKDIDAFFQKSDLIGIGGIAGGVANIGGKQKNYLKFIMDIVGKRKVHWLGQAAENLMAFYKPYSVDSSNWSYGFRYGYTPVFYQGKMRYYYKRDIVSNKQDCRKKIRALGFDWEKCLQEDQWKQGDTILNDLSVKSYLEYSEFIESKLKTIYFLSMNSFSDINSFHQRRFQ